MYVLVECVHMCACDPLLLSITDIHTRITAKRLLIVHSIQITVMMRRFSTRTVMTLTRSEQIQFLLKHMFLEFLKLN